MTDGGSDPDDGPAPGRDVDPGRLRGHAEDLEDRVDDLLARARAGPDELDLPDDPEERALTYCTEGLWPVIAVYVDRRGAGAALGQPHHDRLETALNCWLERYARCYGEDVTVDASVREAAELFVSTHNVRDVAQLLTGVPE